MIFDDLREGYICWLLDVGDIMTYVNTSGGFDRRDYTKLFDSLFNKVFYYDVPGDKNRAADGLELRNEYCNYMGISRPQFEVDLGLTDDCRLLEMVIALARRCEHDIMSNDLYGNRTSTWFWIMMENLGLDGATNDNFDPDEVEFVLDKCLSRDYNFDGTGGAFFVVNSPRMDLREVEIWYQLMWFLSENIDNLED